jgi:hypothetical protein
MDDIVRQAMAKWPNVPDCYGWLGLDARGQWWMRDDRVQAQGSFSSSFGNSNSNSNSNSNLSSQPAARADSLAARGALLEHGKLIDFIHRNYACDAQGCWYFQNGPQRVYIELQATPFVWRVQPDLSLLAHTGLAVRAQRCVLDEQGRLYMETDAGFGLVHSQDMLLAAQAIEQGLWVPQDVAASELPRRFGYVRSPQARVQAIAPPITSPITPLVAQPTPQSAA